MTIPADIIEAIHGRLDTSSTGDMAVDAVDAFLSVLAERGLKITGPDVTDEMARAGDAAGDANCTTEGYYDDERYASWDHVYGPLEVWAAMHNAAPATPWEGADGTEAQS